MKYEGLDPRKGTLHPLNRLQIPLSLSLKAFDTRSCRGAEEINIEEAKAKIDKITAGTLQVSSRLTFA